MTEFRFNLIYVIESLPINEIQTGEILYNELLKRKSYPHVDWMHSALHKIRCKNDLDLFFSRVHSELDKNAWPFFHFEIHGDNLKKGLILSNGELLTWKELADYCRPINIRLKNNLFISLSVCFGADSMLGMEIKLPSPYFGIFAPNKEINGTEIEHFNKFFDILLDTLDLGKSIVTFKKFIEDKGNFELILSEIVFEMVWSKLEEKATTKYNPEEWSLGQPVLLNPSLKNQLQSLIQNLINQKMYFKKIFMHLD